MLDHVGDIHVKLVGSKRLNLRPLGPEPSSMDETFAPVCRGAARSPARLPIRSHPVAFLPEGTEAKLLPLDPGDWLDEEDRSALHQALEDSDKDIKAGRLVDAEVILREVRSR